MKWALIHLGEDESYGLLFVGGELKRAGEEFRYYNGDNLYISALVDYKPDYVCFSPMSSNYIKARKVARVIKDLIEVKSVFGGHHVMAAPDAVEADVKVIGTIVGAVPKILSGDTIIMQPLNDPNDLPMPAREEYYRDIPRMRNRYRKVMMSMMGCPFACTYCSSSYPNTVQRLGTDCAKAGLKRRSVDTVIAEAKEILKYPVKEIEWTDDDILFGDIDWLFDFAAEWDNDIKLPIYISTTSKNILSVNWDILSLLGSFVNCVGLGVQAIREESLKLLGRPWDNEQQMMDAYKVLRDNFLSVNLQAIIGLPIPDPVEDAIETILGLQRIGAGSICSVYPLQVYEGTKMYDYCKENGYELNVSSGNTNTGDTGILFEPKVMKRIKNLCKLATMFVKYNISEDWIRALMDIDLPEESSKQLSLTRYKECVLDRLGTTGQEIFNEVINNMELKY